MKTSLTCPKCNGQRLWVIDRVQHVDGIGASGESQRATATSLTAVDASKRYLGGVIVQPGVRGIGSLEAWTCDGCGYTELYAQGFRDDLATLAQHSDSGVRLHDPKAGGQGPHR